jgi:acyl-CoA reductase-like NAD-dependent aldehyde dehydrogenase
MGSLIDQAHRDRVEGYVMGASRAGATVVVGGSRLDETFPRGAFFAPTLISGVTPDMTIAREEVFGPVLAVMEWERPEEVHAAVAATNFGLTANVWSADYRAAAELADELAVGLAWVNAEVVALPVGVPFGGIRNSGMARDHSQEELESFTYVKVVAS